MMERTICKSALGILFYSTFLTFHHIEHVSSAAVKPKAVTNESYNEHCFARSQSNTLLHHSEHESVPIICPPGYRRHASGEQCHGRYGCCICEYGTYQPHENHCYHCILKTFCPDYDQVFEDYGSITNNSRCGERMTEKDLYTPRGEVYINVVWAVSLLVFALAQGWWAFFPEPEVFTTAAGVLFVQTKGTKDSPDSPTNEPSITLTGDPQLFDPRDPSDTGISFGYLLTHGRVWIVTMFVFIPIITLIFVSVVYLVCPFCCCRLTCCSTWVHAFSRFFAREHQQKTHNYSSVGNINSVVDTSF